MSDSRIEIPRYSELYQLMQLYEPPEFVKQADLEEILCGPEYSDPVAAFADPVYKNFPIHSKAATWMSAVRMYHGGIDQKNVRAAANLKRAAQFFGITREVQRLEKRAEELAAKDALQGRDEDFALVFNDGQQTVRRLPLRTPEEVEKSANWFLEHRDDLAFADRQKVAQRILAKGEEALSPETADTLRKQAGYGFCAPKFALHLVEGRIRFARQKQASCVADLEKTAAAIREQPSLMHQQATREKLAAALDEVDQHLQLKHKYRTGEVTRPEDVLFALNVKYAADVLAQHVKLTSGCVYKKADLKRVPLEALENRFGSDFVEAVSEDGLHVSAEKLAEIVRTLPMTDAEELDALLKAHQIEPVTKEAAAARSGLLHELGQSAHQLR